MRTYYGNAPFNASYRFAWHISLEILNWTNIVIRQTGLIRPNKAFEWSEKLVTLSYDRIAKTFMPLWNQWIYTKLNAFQMRCFGIKNLIRWFNIWMNRQNANKINENSWKVKWTICDLIKVKQGNIKFDAETRSFWLSHFHFRQKLPNVLQSFELNSFIVPPPMM